jgi:hypothetical protein
MSDARKGARPTIGSSLFEQVRDKAITAVRDYMTARSLKIRQAARLLGMPESNLRSFLRGAHKAGPHRQTYRPLLDLNLDTQARDHLLDFLDFEQRVLAQTILRHSTRDRAEIRVVWSGGEAQVRSRESQHSLSPMTLVPAAGPEEKGD